MNLQPSAVHSNAYWRACLQTDTPKAFFHYIVTGRKANVLQRSKVKVAFGLGVLDLASTTLNDLASLSHKF